MARSFPKAMPPAEPGASPVNAVPPTVVVLVLVLALVEAALSLGAEGLAGGPGAVGWRIGLIERFSVSGAVLDFAAAQPGLLTRLLTYPLVHASLVHALFACVFLLALGKFVAEGLGQGRMLLVLLAGTVGGALAYGLLVPGTRPLFGAYPAAYGLIGGFTYLLWLRLGREGGNKLQAFRLIGFLMAFQLLFGALFGGNAQWVGDVGGFVAGGAVAVLLSPGGVGALRARLRAR